MTQADDFRHRRFGFGVRANLYHPTAVRFPPLRADPGYAREAVLTVAAGGGLEFVVCDEPQMPRLLYAPRGLRRLWRAETEAEALGKAAELRAEEDRSDPNLAWGASAFAVPDEQALLTIVRRRGLQGEMRRFALLGAPFSGFDRFVPADAAAAPSRGM